MHITLRLLACLLLASCATTTAPVKEPTRVGQAALEVLTSFFTGNWESVPADPPRTMRVAEFWKGGSVRWFYLEWTRPGETRPLRQHVLRVAEGAEPGALAITVQRLPGDAAAYAGEWRKAQPFEALRPGQLAGIDACRLQGLRSMDAVFVMGTEGTRCPGDLPGAPYVRYELTITSSDLGFSELPIDAAGNVLPGSRGDPYRYRRVGNVPR